MENRNLQREENINWWPFRFQYHSSVKLILYGNESTKIHKFIVSEILSFPSRFLNSSLSTENIFISLIFHSDVNRVEIGGRDRENSLKQIDENWHLFNYLFSFQIEYHLSVRAYYGQRQLDRMNCVCTTIEIEPKIFIESREFSEFFILS